MSKPPRAPHGHHHPASGRSIDHADTHDAAFGPHAAPIRRYLAAIAAADCAVALRAFAVEAEAWEADTDADYATLVNACLLLEAAEDADACGHAAAFRAALGVAIVAGPCAGDHPAGEGDDVGRGALLLTLAGLAMLYRDLLAPDAYARVTRAAFATLPDGAWPEHTQASLEEGGRDGVA